MTCALTMVDSIPLLHMEEDNRPTAEKIEKTFLTCPICFEVYTRPKCLSCLHTFCSDCLLSYIESKDMYGIRREMGFPCPVCKQVMSIKNYHKPYKAWLDEIQNNFLIQNMIDCLVPNQEEEELRNGDDADFETNEDADVTGSPAHSDGHNTPPHRVSSPTPQNPSSPLHTAGGLDIPASDLLRMYSSQYGLTQQWATSPRRSSSGVHNTQGFHRGESAFLAGAAEEDCPSGPRAIGSISTLIPRNPNITFRETNTLQQTYDMTANNWADYKPARLSDVLCLPKHNGIIALDYDNRCVKYVKNVFLRRNVTTAMEVVGRPCCVALLNKDTEERIVVTVLNRNKLYFLRVPELEMIDVMDTQRAYRGVTVLNPSTVLAGSPGKPTCVDIIYIDHRCKKVAARTIYRNGHHDGIWNWDLHLPHYITAVSPTSFVVSDPRKNSLVYFDVESVNGSIKAVKRFTLTPPAQLQSREVGGLCYHNGYVYFVDKGAEEVYKVSLGSSVECVAILKPRNGIRKPASVCVGPNDEICVVDWDGRVGLYKNR